MKTQTNLCRTYSVTPLPAATYKRGGGGQCGSIFNKMIMIAVMIIITLVTLSCHGIFERSITITDAHTDLPMSPGDSVINGIVVVRVNAANQTFTMGSPPSEADRYFDETQREVTLAKNFWMSKYPVTNRQYGRRVPDDQLEHPVVFVSWYEARDFAARIRGRLPTEAEWEFAARGGAAGVSRNHLYSGGDDLDAVAWCADTSGALRSMWETVDSAAGKIPNELGIYDMSGNVWEWVNDWYGYHADFAIPDPDPTGPESGDDKVHRGGSWRSPARECRVAERGHSNPSHTSNNLGFRVVFDVE